MLATSGLRASTRRAELGRGALAGVERAFRASEGTRHRINSNLSLSNGALSLDSVVPAKAMAGLRGWRRLVGSKRSCASRAGLLVVELEIAGLLER
jgi:hypothetical protein